MHLVDLLELRQVFHSHVDALLLQSLLELGIGGDQNVFAIELANVQEIDHKLKLLFVGCFDYLVSLIY